jgi:hypothetical protein
MSKDTLETYSFNPFDNPKNAQVLNSVQNNINSLRKLEDTSEGNGLSYSPFSGTSSLFLQNRLFEDEPASSPQKLSFEMFRQENAPMSSESTPDAVDVLHTFNFLHMDDEDSQSEPLAIGTHPLPLNSEDLKLFLTEQDIASSKAKDPTYVAQVLLKVFPGLSLDKCQRYLNKTNFDLERALSLLLTEETQNGKLKKKEPSGKA